MTISLIAAIGQNGQLGLNGNLPWPHHKEDMAWFREITAGKVMIAGYRTYEGLRGIKWDLGRELTNSLPDMITKEIIIIGGAATYRKFASRITTLYLSRINYKGDADTWFPFDAFTGEQIDNVIWRE